MKTYGLHLGMGALLRPNYGKTFAKYIRITMIFTDFPNVNKKSHDHHFLWVKMEFFHGEIPTKSVNISVILLCKSLNVVRISLSANIFYSIILALHFFTSLKHLKKLIFLLTSIHFQCQKLWILSHLSELFDVPAGC